MGACTSIIAKKEHEGDDKCDFPNPFLLLLRDYLSIQDRERARSVNSRWYAIFSDAKPSLRLYSVKATLGTIQCTSGSKGVLRDFTYYFDPNEKHSDKKTLRIKSERTMSSILRNVKWIDHVSLQCLNTLILRQFHDTHDRLKFSIGYLDIHISEKLKESLLELYCRKFVEVTRHRVHIYLDPGMDTSNSAAYQRALFSAFGYQAVFQDLWVIPNELVLHSLEEISLQRCPPKINCKHLDITIIRKNGSIPLADLLFPKGIPAFLENDVEGLMISAGGWEDDEQTANSFWSAQMKEELVDRVQNVLLNFPNAKLSEVEFRKYCPHQEEPINRFGQVTVQQRCTVYFTKLKCFPDKAIY